MKGYEIYKKRVKSLIDENDKRKSRLNNYIDFMEDINRYLIKLNKIKDRISDYQNYWRYNNAIQGLFPEYDKLIINNKTENIDNQDYEDDYYKYDDDEGNVRQRAVMTEVDTEDNENENENNESEDNEDNENEDNVRQKAIMTEVEIEDNENKNKNNEIEENKKENIKEGGNDKENRKEKENSGNERQRVLVSEDYIENTTNHTIQQPEKIKPEKKVYIPPHKYIPPIYHSEDAIVFEEYLEDESLIDRSYSSIESVDNEKKYKENKKNDDNPSNEENNVNEPEEHENNYNDREEYADPNEDYDEEELKEEEDNKEEDNKEEENKEDKEEDNNKEEENKEDDIQDNIYNQNNQESSGIKHPNDINLNIYDYSIGNNWTMYLGKKSYESEYINITNIKRSYKIGIIIINETRYNFYGLINYLDGESQKYNYPRKHSLIIIMIKDFINGIRNINSNNSSIIFSHMLGVLLSPIILLCKLLYKIFTIFSFLNIFMPNSIYNYYNNTQNYISNTEFLNNTWNTPLQFYHYYYPSINKTSYV